MDFILIICDEFMVGVMEWLMFGCSFLLLLDVCCLYWFLYWFSFGKWVWIYVVGGWWEVGVLNWIMGWIVVIIVIIVLKWWVGYLLLNLFLVVGFFCWFCIFGLIIWCYVVFRVLLFIVLVGFYLILGNNVSWVIWLCLVLLMIVFCVCYCCFLFFLFESKVLVVWRWNCGVK